MAKAIITWGTMIREAMAHPQDPARKHSYTGIIRIRFAGRQRMSITLSATDLDHWPGWLPVIVTG
jgi:hypothetical protein